MDYIIYYKAGTSTEPKKTNEVLKQLQPSEFIGSSATIPS